MAFTDRHGFARDLPLSTLRESVGTVAHGSDYPQPDQLLPLYLLHIAKTGGTSLSAALSEFYCDGEVISDSGNISVDFIKKNEHRLCATALLYGHAGHEVMTYLRGRVRAITLLRDPKAQAISNYLHIARDINNPFQPIAVNLGLVGFFTTFWQYAIFQTLSLVVSISREPARFREEIESRIGRVFELLDQMFFVGQLEKIDDLAPLLSLLLGLPGCLTVPRLNTAAENGVEEPILDRLGAEYDRLQDNPEIAHLLSLERSIYQKVGSLRKRYEREIVERVFRAKWAGPTPPSAVYAGSNGTIYLASNWRSPETTSEGRGWWTGNSECSTLLIEMTPEVVALEAEIYVTHFVGKIVFEADGLRLDHTEKATADDPRQIRVDLRALAPIEHCTLTLRLAREIPPSIPPYYPALALRRFRLI